MVSCRCSLQPLQCIKPSFRQRALKHCALVVAAVRGSQGVHQQPAGGGFKGYKKQCGLPEIGVPGYT